MEVVATAHGGPEVLACQPASYTPDQVELKDDEVLVRNAYAGVNFIDTYYRSGLYTKPTMPYVVGEEGAGAVLKVGAGVSTALLGKRVAYYGGLGSSGSYASFSTVRGSAVREIPPGVSDEAAAAVMCQGLTAHYLIDASYPCAPGSTVVVHAAAGGTGLLVCQMAKLRGARVIGVCGGAEKAALARSVGRADVVIDHAATPDWAAAVRAVAPAHGVDAVYDGVGRSTFAGSLSLLRKRGYMISFGNASGAVPPVAPLELSRAGSVYLQRPTLADFMLTAEEADRRAAEVFGWIASKQLTLTIGHVYPLRDAAQAHIDLESRKTTGKLLIKCTDDA
ncbi:putative quinone oxidoreductase [Leptomonas pyrrhocoris]|uniref:Probable quinone oxidoreductase n=1 Tax=Leptomonas pyrrhocoris TaxID=157538 RepID=A0A0M9FQ48_LEPPY|nr:putative quinone oxidoreductase [Leptomonas pyrrhocoris]KPA73639.1 putative quinone oxidoreductase [Leptomonas pyrrhocoris]|eukprot:XP_015652078.1 putative quinone oxidoreductase [Leptomonas pyrrhocoris]